MAETLELKLNISCSFKPSSHDKTSARLYTAEELSETQTRGEDSSHGTLWKFSLHKNWQQQTGTEKNGRETHLL